LLVALLLGGASPSLAQVLMVPRNHPLPTRTPAECVGVTAPPGANKDTPDYVPVGPFGVIPSFDALRSVRGKEVEVRVLIGARGTLDSVEVAGLTDEKFKARYIKSLKEAATKNKLGPAIYQGCAVDAWWSYTWSMGGGAELMPRLTPSALLAAALLLAGCADRAAVPRTWAATPVIVTGTGDTITMRETLRVGVLDGDPNYQFNRISWMLARRDGGVLVHDLVSNTKGGLIRQYDAQGRFVRVIGGRGDGPGEYDDFPEGTLLADGSLLIVEQGQARITRFDSAGKFTGSWPGPTSIVDIAPATDGGWYVANVSAHYPQEDRPRGISYYRYDQQGRLVDTIPAPAAYRDGPFAGSDGPRAMTLVLPDGRFVSSRTDSIAFVVDGPTGSASYARPSDRARYNDEEKQALVAMFAAVSRRSGQQPRPMQVPDLKQAFWYLVSDPAGRILFLRRTVGFRIADTTDLRPEEPRWRGTLEIDVFDSSATYRGRLVTPRDVATRVYAFGKGHLWLMHEGASGELYLVRWEPTREAW
jgi:hypothetical protein